tara:strand:- start:23 stop:229 length:207 start_codon:yes stop_codon:yes gene_type:complete
VPPVSEGLTVIELVLAEQFDVPDTLITVLVLPLWAVIDTLTDDSLRVVGPEALVGTILVVADTVILAS